MGVSNRYKNCEVRELEGEQYLGTREVAEKERRSDDRFHVLVEGETADILADNYLGDPRLWWVICDYNGIPFMLDLPAPGTMIRIPSVDYTMMDLVEK